jgi:hypothetical protein
MPSRFPAAPASERARPVATTTAVGIRREAEQVELHDPEFL